MPQELECENRNTPGLPEQYFFFGEGGRGGTPYIIVYYSGCGNCAENEKQDVMSVLRGYMTARLSVMGAIEKLKGLDVNFDWYPGGLTEC